MRRTMPQPFVITELERTDLEHLVRSSSLPAGLVRRAEMILRSARGESVRAIARQVGVTAPVVTLWRRRFRRDRLAGLYDAPRSGRPRTHDDDEIARLLRTVLHQKPIAATHWSVRGLAAKTGISKTTVQRYLSLFGAQPHRTRSFSLSTDPFFLEKVRDIVGLYLQPPAHALVLCVDEKSQIQALERTQPSLPMGLGYVEGVTHGYKRHGTTTLFAALDVERGTVLTQCKPRHRHQEFLGFLRHIEANVPPGLDVHLILDNYATHKHPKVKAWLAHRPRYHVHFTPTYSSWLNQVERWFGLITQHAVRRGSFRHVRELVRRIDEYSAHYNRSAAPFAWTATAESILDKVKRIAQVINGTQH
jgi:transposase